MRKQFAVFGLGSFGKSVALTLESFGCDVIVVDNSYEKVQEISDSVAYAIRADASDPDAMKELGGRNLDAAIVAISEDMEAGIMATIISKEMGIPYVLAKAKNDLQGTILKKVGADEVVFPERDMGCRVAKNLVSAAFTDWIELSPEYSLTEKLIPKQWVGKSLVELKIREKYGMNVVGLMKDGHVDVTFNPRNPLPEDCILIIIGANSVLEKFEENRI